MRQWKGDKSRLLITVDKGVVMVVMDKQGYMDKAKNLLEQPTSRSLPADPTNKYGAKLIKILKWIKKGTRHVCSHL